MPERSDWDLGRAALLEITSAESIGENAGSIDEADGVTTVYFDTTLSGYPGWRWTVSIAHVEGEQPSVLETELTPGDTALLSPAWIPWVDRLADYKAAQEALGVEAAEESTDDDDEDDDDELDNDVLHGGDLDGVDIDEAEEDDDSDEDDSGFAAPDDGPAETEHADDESADDGPEDLPEDLDAEQAAEDDDEQDKSY
jgi:hypothetical protein